MPPHYLVADVPCISVLDDETEAAEGLARGLRRKGFKVELLSPETPDLADTVATIVELSDAALCDHALRGGMHVDFSGAEVVAALHDQGFPAVLFTGVRPEDRYAIRRNMARIPGFLHRDHEEGLRVPRVLRELAESIHEVREGQRPRRRQPRRTPVTVVEARRTGRESLVSVRISGWPGLSDVEVPADLLASPWSDAPRDAVGRTFFARVNIGEMDEQKLFFEDFEGAPAESSHFRGWV